MGRCRRRTNGHARNADGESGDGRVRDDGQSHDYHSAGFPHGGVRRDGGLLRDGRPDGGSLRDGHRGDPCCGDRRDAHRGGRRREA